MAEINFNIKKEPNDFTEKPIKSIVKIEANTTEKNCLISSCETCETPIDPRWGNRHYKDIKRESLNPECSCDEKENEVYVKREDAPHSIMKDEDCNIPVIPKPPTIDENRNSYQERNHNPRHYYSNYKGNLNYRGSSSNSQNFKRYRYQKFNNFHPRRFQRKFKNPHYQQRMNIAVSKVDPYIHSQRSLGIYQNQNELFNPLEENREVPSSPSMFSNEDYSMDDNCDSSSEFSSAAATPPITTSERATDTPLSANHKPHQSSESLMLNFPSGNQVKFLILDQVHENLINRAPENEFSSETLVSPSTSLQESSFQCNNGSEVSNISKKAASSETLISPFTSLQKSISQCNNGSEVSKISENATSSETLIYSSTSLQESICNNGSEVSKTEKATSSETLISPSTSLQEAVSQCSNISGGKDSLHDITLCSTNSNNNMKRKCDEMVDLEIICENISDIKVVKEIHSSGEIECIFNKCKEWHLCAKCYLYRKKLKNDKDIICLGKVRKLPSKGNVQVITLADKEN